ncbi:MAG: hypothetical protein QM661_05075 [Solimonas sp.]
MRRRPAQSLLLVLALALGQWLALAHSFEHPALHADAVCQICAHAQGLDGAALTPVFSLPAAVAVAEAPSIGIVLPARAAAPRIYDIRGPPAQAIVITV